MDFPDAMRALLGGEIVTRTTWMAGPLEVYQRKSDGVWIVLKNATHGTLKYRWTPERNDMFGEDWIIVSGGISGDAEGK